MTDRDIKTIELIINNEQAKKRLDELKVGSEALIVSFSDFIATFAMSVGFDTYFDLQH